MIDDSLFMIIMKNGKDEALIKSRKSFTAKRTATLHQLAEQIQLDIKIRSFG